jgi:hypothetical protein
MGLFQNIETVIFTGASVTGAGLTTGFDSWLVQEFLSSPAVSFSSCKRLKLEGLSGAKV